MPLQIIQGDMWTEFGTTADLFLVTTNAFVKRSGELVMGRGIAKQAAQKSKWQLPMVFGKMIMEAGVYECADFYGVLVSNLDFNSPRAEVKTRFGTYQVKYHWQDPARLSLISKSARMLEQIAPEYNRIVLNFPGIGNGGLPREKVLPVLEERLGHLENLYIYEYVKAEATETPATDLHESAEHSATGSHEGSRRHSSALAKAGDLPDL
jgi:hypothetical protein